MAILIRTSVMRHCALALLLVALTAAVCIAQTDPGETDPDPEDEYPIVDCPVTQTNCNMCRQIEPDLIFCMMCADGYSTNVPSGMCEAYSGECTAEGCIRCASNNPTLCINCDEGYTHSIDTMHCLTPVTDSSSEAPVTPPTEAPATSSSSSDPAPPPSTEAPTEPPSTGDSSSSAPVLPPTTEAPTEPPTPTPAPTEPPTTTPAPTEAPCLAPQCAVCSSGSSTVCVACNTGYTLMNYGACKPTGSCAVANCAQCYSDDDTFCSVCSNGYRPTVTGGCRRGNGAAYAHPTALVAIVMALVAYAATML